MLDDRPHGRKVEGNRFRQLAAAMLGERCGQLDRIDRGKAQLAEAAVRGDLGFRKAQFDRQPIAQPARQRRGIVGAGRLCGSGIDRRGACAGGRGAPFRNDRKLASAPSALVGGALDLAARRPQHPARLDQDDVRQLDLQLLPHRVADGAEQRLGIGAPLRALQLLDQRHLLDALLVRHPEGSTVADPHRRRPVMAEISRNCWP